MLENLKEQSNIALCRNGLETDMGQCSWNRQEQRLEVIKPSGVPMMKPEHMVVTDLDGNVVGDLKPSSIRRLIWFMQNFEDIGVVIPICRATSFAVVARHSGSGHHLETPFGEHLQENDRKRDPCL